MSAFSPREREYLLEQPTAGHRLARLATVGRDGTPHVVPVGFRYLADEDVVEIGGMALERTKKFRDARRAGRAAVVVDDLATVDPWRPRGVEIRGRAETRMEPRPVIRVHADRVVSWGLE
jgi:pyridoxamine 5'-phosphate oxidase family protein